MLFRNFNFGSLSRSFFVARIFFVLLFAVATPLTAYGQQSASDPVIVESRACPQISSPANSCFSLSQMKPSEYVVLVVSNVFQYNTLKVFLDGSTELQQQNFVRNGGNLATVVAALPQDIEPGSAHQVAVIIDQGNVPSAPVNLSIRGVAPSTAPTGGGGASGGGSTTPKPTVNPNAGGSVKDGLKGIAGEFQYQGELAQSQTIGDVIVAVINVLLGLLMAISVLMIIFGGFTYVTAAGAEDKAKKARRIITYAVTGMIIVILSYMLVSTISNALDGQI